MKFVALEANFSQLSEYLHSDPPRWTFVAIGCNTWISRQAKNSKKTVILEKSKYYNGLKLSETNMKTALYLKSTKTVFFSPKRKKSLNKYDRYERWNVTQALLISCNYIGKCHKSTVMALQLNPLCLFVALTHTSFMVFCRLNKKPDNISVAIFW